MKIRIHHFFDIIRDFGAGKEIAPHPYGHSYHKVAEKIYNDPEINLELVIGADAVCEDCIKQKNNRCEDFITHRKDFSRKEDFNNYLDKRILKICKIDPAKKYTPKSLLEFAPSYLENIETIYAGNDTRHTMQRKENVLKGLKLYPAK